MDYFCPWCEVEHQPVGVSTPGLLKFHIMQAHGPETEFFLPMNQDRYWESDSTERRAYPRDSFIHCDCGRLFVTTHLARHKQNCKCVNDNHRKYYHPKCNCNGCNNNILPTDGFCTLECCTHPLPPEIRDFVRAISFTKDYTIEDIANIVKVTKVIELPHQSEYSKCINLIIDKFKQIYASNYPEKNRYMSMTTVILLLVPALIARKIRQKGRVDSRKNLFERFLGLEFEDLLTDARENWSNNVFVPTRKPNSKEVKKIQIAIDQARRGQLRKALKVIAGDALVDDSEIDQAMVDHIQTKLPHYPETHFNDCANQDFYRPNDPDLTELTMRKALKGIDLYGGTGLSGLSAGHMFFPFLKLQSRLTDEERKMKKNMTWFCSKIRKGFRPINQWIKDNKLSCFEKPNDTPTGATTPLNRRPIQCADILERHVARCCNVEHLPDYKGKLPRHQHALRRSGIEFACFSLEAFMEENPLGYIMPNDIKNAFNSGVLRAILARVKAEMPEIYAFFASTNYGGYKAKFSNGLFAQVLEGIRQGCPLSMHIYCSFIAPFLHEIDLQLRAENLGKVDAYADDWAIFSRHQTYAPRINQIFYQAMEKLEAVGQKINRSKSKIYVWGDLIVEPEFLKPFPEYGFIGKEEGLKFLGSYKSTNPTFIQSKLKEKTLEIQRLLDKLQILKHYPQEAILLVRSCIIPKLMHFPRTIAGDIIRDWALDVDHRINLFLAKLLEWHHEDGVENYINDPNANKRTFADWPITMQEFRLPSFNGGKSLPNIHTTLDAAYITGYVSAVQIDDELKPPVQFFRAIKNIVSMVYSTNNLPNEASIEERKQDLSKHKLSRMKLIHKLLPEELDPCEINSMEMQQFVQSATDKMDVLMEKLRTSRLNKKLNGIINSILADMMQVVKMRPENYGSDKERKQAMAIHLSASHKWCSLYTKIIPYSPDMIMSADEYKLNIHYDLHIPVKNGELAENIGLKCNNGSHPNTKIDKYGLHLMGCHHTAYHNAGRDELVRALSQAGCGVLTEPVGVLNQPGQRPDLLITGLSDNGKDILVDFTTVSVTTQSRLDNTSKIPGYAAEEAEQKKIDKYQGKYDPGKYEFVALAMELSGRPSKTLEKFMKKIGRKAADKNAAQDYREPKQYEKQFTYKWTLRLVTAVRKTMARRANNHMFRLIRDKQNNHLHLTNDEIYNHHY